MMAEILYQSIFVVVDEEEEAKDDEMQPQAVPVKKDAPWQIDIYTQKWRLSIAASNTLQIHAGLH